MHFSNFLFAAVLAGAQVSLAQDDSYHSALEARADKVAINAAGHAIDAAKAVNNRLKADSHHNSGRPSFANIKAAPISVGGNKVPIKKAEDSFATTANTIKHLNQAQNAFKNKHSGNSKRRRRVPRRRSVLLTRADKIAINAAGHAIDALKAANKQAKVGDVNRPRPNFASAANAVNHVNKAQTAFKAKTGPEPLPLPKKKSSEILKQATAFKKNSRREAEPADKIAINAAGHAIDALKAANKQAKVGDVNRPRPNFATAANAVHQVNKAQTAFKAKTGPAPLPLPKKKSSEILKQATAFKNGKRAVMYVREAEAEPLYFGMADEEDEGIYAREAEPEAWYEEGEFEYSLLD